MWYTLGYDVGDIVPNDDSGQEVAVVVATAAADPVKETTTITQSLSSPSQSKIANDITTIDTNPPATTNANNTATNDYC